jgi:hypothetical protein
LAKSGNFPGEAADKLMPASFILAYQRPMICAPAALISARQPWSTQPLYLCGPM